MSVAGVELHVAVILVPARLLAVHDRNSEVEVRSRQVEPQSSMLVRGGIQRSLSAPSFLV